MKESNKNFLNILSYVAFLTIALLLAITNFLPLIGVVIKGTIVNFLETLKNVLILFIIGVLAFKFAFNQGAKWVKVLYWVSLGIFIVGTILIWL